MFVHLFLRVVLISDFISFVIAVWLRYFVYFSQRRWYRCIDIFTFVLIGICTVYLKVECFRMSSTYAFT